MSKPVPRAPADGRLDVVATPIGNLTDASPRMRETLAAADLVVAEDTRRSGRLLREFGLDRPLFALHDHNEADVVPGLVAKLAAGARIALISDAGTPAISDPGFRLVRAARDAGIEVRAVPGPSALVAALSISGLPTDRFAFEGFPPARAAARRACFEALADEPRTLVFFEAVHRIEAALRDAADVFGGEREALLARELTKRFEQSERGTLEDLLAKVADGRIPAKGEFVLVISGRARATDQSAAALSIDAPALMQRLVAEGFGRAAAARLVASISGMSRNALYAVAGDEP